VLYCFVTKAAAAGTANPQRYVLRRCVPLCPATLCPCNAMSCNTVSRCVPQRCVLQGEPPRNAQDWRRKCDQGSTAPAFRQGPGIHIRQARSIQVGKCASKGTGSTVCRALKRQQCVFTAVQILQQVLICAGHRASSAAAAELPAAGASVTAEQQM
jgi:hypothetical protein